MKPHRPLLCALAAGLLLTSCAPAANPPTETTPQTVTTAHLSTEPVSSSATGTTTSARTDTATEIPGTFLYASHELVEEEDISYVRAEGDLIVALACEEEKIVIPAPATDEFDEFDEFAEPYSYTGIYFKERHFGKTYFQNDVAAYLPACTSLTVGEGIEKLWWDPQYMYVPKLKTLTLPSTLTTLYTVCQPELAPLVDEHLKAAALPYQPDAAAHLDASTPMPTMILSDVFSEETFLTMQRDNACNALFAAWDNLKYIDVADGNDAFYDIDGVLYFTESAAYFGLEFLLWHPMRSGSPQKRLLCVPRNYACENGVYTIPDGTDYLHGGAIYRCRNIDTVIVPDSMVYLAPASIVASADRPLTVVCSPDSAAAQYVAQFGKLYHLTLQWIE